MTLGGAYLTALVGLFLLNGLVRRWVHRQGGRMRAFFCSPSGKPSLSLLQAWLWTQVTLFALLAGAARTGRWPLLDERLLVLVGGGYGVAVSARWIALAADTGGAVARVKAPPPRGWAGLFWTDGQLRLSKFQAFLLTAAALVVFLYQTHRALEGAGVGTVLELPGLPDPFLALLGLSQGGYLGFKWRMKGEGG